MASKPGFRSFKYNVYFMSGNGVHPTAKACSKVKGTIFGRVCLLSKNIPKKFSIFSLKKRRRSKKVKMSKKQKGRMLTIVRVKRVMTEKYGNTQSKQC